MSSQKALIDKYIFILLEYIHLIDASEIIRGLDNQLSVFNIGLHSIAHIYKLTYYITKNVETAGCYTQKGVYCYLEYIEQMNRTNSLHNLNNTDAVLFVYDKTLSEMYNTNERGIISHEQNMFSNIVSLNHPQSREQNWKIILEHISNITQTILWNTNPCITFSQRLNIAHDYLPKYMNLYAESSTPPTTLDIIHYITLIQDKLVITHNEYIDFLDSFYKIFKQTAKVRTRNMKNANHTRLINGGNTLISRKGIREFSGNELLPEENVHINTDKPTLDEFPSLLDNNNQIDKYLCISVNFSGKTLEQVISSEYGKNEGWKTRFDFIRWLFL